ncbi:hypothetical protein GCM10010470_65960 [Saccharopolyspora taberi]|uniref:Uncharacterized protein n=2 Tax=Saccharopolyspora taberi TaxID=60895 RepID=A0ABN3VPH6_9PSEU
MKRALLNPGWRTRRALRSAAVLDEVVDSQVGMVPGLPPELRKRSADHLAELVLLAQSYRHYAAGWIDRRELEHRACAALDRMESRRGPRLGQLTERE